MKNLIALIILTLVGLKCETNERTKYFAGLLEIPVTMPTLAPEISQTTIDIAVLAFNIKIPLHCNYPKLDMKLPARGMTILSSFSNNKIVTIGKPAFTSWGLLGSTLGHEIEVHCNQDLAMLVMMDIAGLKGVCKAEREAYVFEINNAKRFGLTKDQVDDIKDTMEHYYSSCK